MNVHMNARGNSAVTKRISLRHSRERTRRVTANLPADVLEGACRTSGKGITETIVTGLELVQRSAAVEKAKKLKGKLKLRVDLQVSRERSGR